MENTWNTRHSLLDRLVKGDDSEDWEVFAQHYRPFIRAILSRMSISPSDQDDLSQQILIKLHKNLAAYKKEKGRFHDWLATVIKNTTLNFIKKQKAEQSRRDDADTAALPGGDSELDQMIHDEWREYMLSEALRRVEEVVSDGVMACFRMSLDNVPAEEIAETLEIKVETVYITRNRMKTRMQRELRRLMDELEF
jgi:RNA polymerase sigma-70 factor (ECF subfamily)